MKQCTKWEFKTLREQTKFIKKFYEIQEVFFPDNTITTNYIAPHDEFPACYYATLTDKPVSRKIEDEKIDDRESLVGAYDSLTFMKQAESGQKPDRSSYMRRVKQIKVKEKK
jgi:hypothetical protein